MTVKTCSCATGNQIPIQIHEKFTVTELFIYTS